MTSTGGAQGDPKGTIASLPYKPDKPDMGGLIQTGKEDWTPWVGGKPKHDWTSLEESSPKFIDPRQCRPTSAGSAQKSKACRVVPVEPKLSKGGNLLDFLKNFKKRLETHGLDTVTYLPNPEKENEVLSALAHHSRCTREKATKPALVHCALFDAHATRVQHAWNRQGRLWTCVRLWT